MELPARLALRWELVGCDDLASRTLGVGRLTGEAEVRNDRLADLDAVDKAVDPKAGPTPHRAANQ